MNRCEMNGELSRRQNISIRLKPKTAGARPGRAAAEQLSTSAPAGIFIKIPGPDKFIVGIEYTAVS
eukprot:SAG31_NODE_67_length_28318_cov_6.493674_7_plen_66_part_00